MSNTFTFTFAVAVVDFGLYDTKYKNSLSAEIFSRWNIKFQISRVAKKKYPRVNWCCCIIHPSDFFSSRRDAIGARDEMNSRQSKRITGEKLYGLINPIPAALRICETGDLYLVYARGRGRWISPSRRVHLPSYTSAMKLTVRPAGRPHELLSALFRVLWPWVAARENFCEDVDGERVQLGIFFPDRRERRDNEQCIARGMYVHTSV